ncbi:hypothetical protein LR066_02140 [candidate division WOR-3 bacterium]|nr:hypothetical protein [candidate division WOR-3 bacterium]
MFSLRRTVVLSVLGLVGILCLFGRPVQAALQVFPHLIEMDRRQRTASLYLTNLGGTTERYRISLGYVALNEEGQIVEMEPGPEHLSAIELVRFMPRSVTLAPDEYQVVRLRLRMPAELADGEYRAHIFFEQVPPTPALPDEGETPAEGVTVLLTALQRLGIPIVVTKGELKMSGEVSEVSLEELEGGPLLSFRVTNTGSRSLRGNMVVELLPRDGGRAIPLFLMRKFVVYTPGFRRVVIPLKKEGLAWETGSRLRLIYREGEGQEGRIIAQAEMEI